MKQPRPGPVVPPRDCTRCGGVAEWDGLGYRCIDCGQQFTKRMKEVRT